MFDATGRCTFVEDFPTPLLGWGRDAVGRHLRELVPSPHGPGLDEYLTSIAGRTGTHPPRVVRVDDRFGEPRRLELVVTNLLHDPLVRGMVFDARDVTDRHEAETSLRHLGHHDPLTGLVNRASLLRTIEESLEHDSQDGASRTTVFTLRVGRLQVVNDSAGHVAGDEVLIVLANRFRAAVDAGHTIARVTGAEFAVCSTTDDTPSARRLAEHLVELTRKPIAVGEHQVVLDAAVGVARGRPTEGPDQLMRRAGEALQHSRRSGTRRIVFSDEITRRPAAHPVEVEHDLRNALRRNELRLAYQPVVRLADEHVIGVEALIRWQHPTRGLLVPDDFIPIAEDAGLMAPIGHWVVGRACADLASWRRDAALSNLSVAINVSARQLVDDDEIMSIVHHALDANGLPGSALTMEVTETSSIRDEATALVVLTRLRDAGVGLAIDDFGTGYSSLANLRTFRFDSLKIDRSFVAALGTGDDGAAEIVSAIVDLAHALGISVVAEGVESPRQADEVTGLGCDHGQGYLWSFVDGRVTRAATPPATA